MAWLDDQESVDRKPQLDLARIEQLAREHFELEGYCSPLPSERDLNCRLQDSSGNSFVLKFANRDCDLEFLLCQHAALRHVAGRFAFHQSPCPLPLVSKLGEDLIQVEDEKGEPCWFRAVPYLAGIPLAKTKPHSGELLDRVGEVVGQVSGALLVDFEHPGSKRKFRWDLHHADEVLADCETFFESEQLRIVQLVRDLYHERVVPRKQQLRCSVIHGDANDYNLIVDRNATNQLQALSLIDFGDLIHSQTVNDLAIALAYVMQQKDAPLSAAARVVAGFHRSLPLSEVEIEVIYPLALMRLAVSLGLSLAQQQKSDDPYLAISRAPTWDLLQRLEKTSADLATYTFRAACGLEPCPQSPALINRLKDQANTFHPIIRELESSQRSASLDLSIESTQLKIQELLGEIVSAGEDGTRYLPPPGEVTVGRYGEPRACYQGEQFDAQSNRAATPRTRHLGIDLFASAGTIVHAPLSGTIVGCQDNNAAFDYGPTLILEHQLDTHLKFYTLYGHLCRDSLTQHQVGRRVTAGDEIARLGNASENGGWPPHLHFQLICDLMGCEGDFPGVAAGAEWSLWSSLSPSPLIFFPTLTMEQVDHQRSSETSTSMTDDLLARRQQVLSRSLSLSYSQPLHIVRGYRQYLYDADALRYLDCVNNVCHVGHCHPHVVEAIAEQAGLLNTNTRYLHQNLIQLGERLSGTMPDSLEVCFFVNSGSEANDLALRLARNYTGTEQTVVVDHAYHGNLSSLIDVSPYKHAGPGGAGPPAHVAVAPMPDEYRGIHQRSTAFGGDASAIGKLYAADLLKTLDSAEGWNSRRCTFIAESILSCGGQVMLPEGYLQEVYQIIRQRGGVCIADEVQVGFGRVGESYWGFELQKVTPDIVTMGKPMGNGHPIGAVVTTREIADAFLTGMEYFNTFGGNPVSAAAACAVLDVIEQEQMQRRALLIGQEFLQRLLGLQREFEVIGDVRGRGLFLGIEFVKSREQKEPHTQLAKHIVEKARQRRILLSTDGPDRNVVKIKPPMCFDERDLEVVVEAIAESMTDNLMLG